MPAHPAPDLDRTHSIAHSAYDLARVDLHLQAQLAAHAQRGNHVPADTNLPPCKPTSTCAETPAPAPANACALPDTEATTGSHTGFVREPKGTLNPMTRNGKTCYYPYA